MPPILSNNALGLTAKETQMVTQKHATSTRAPAAGEAADRALKTLRRQLRDAVDQVITTALDVSHGQTKVVNMAVLANQIARPATGGRCAAVWDQLDKVRAQAKGGVPSLGDVRKLAKKHHWNENNARIEYYRWRAFNGIHRSAKTMHRQRYAGNA